MPFEAILNSLVEPNEMLKRVKLLTEARYILGEPHVSTFEENFKGKGYDRYFFEDGAGSEGTIIFKADKEHVDSVLMFSYDHESSFNYYGIPEGQNKQTIFNNLPEQFKYLITGDDLKWSWDNTDPENIYATAAVWREHGDTKWHVSSDYAKESSELQDNGGFVYAFDLFMRPLDVARFEKSFENEGREAEELKFTENLYKKHFN